MEHAILESIREPADLRRLGAKELIRLALEIRSRIMSTVSRNGGHLASNLGVVELTIALHRVFDSPRDKIVWDVGHQCYAHKLLTGRQDDFESLRRLGGIAGFPKRAESVHDVFNTGHASTSISAALGLLAGERLRGGAGRAVAVIGDGALTGGLAYEALSHAGQLGLPLVVVLNDNKMSISPNVGGLSKHLSRLSMKAKYQLFRRTFDALVQRIPGIGEPLYQAILRMKRAVKAVFYTDNFFVDLGFEYVGPIDGHSIPQLEQVFSDVRKLDRPVVIHVITRKGKGYPYAEDDPGSYHGVGSFSVVGGIDPVGEARSFTAAFSEALIAAGRRDKRVIALTAAMEQGTGLASFRALFPRRFFDAGIAEEHAVTFAAALAAQGQKPVAAIYSTFMQRAVDQVIHDTALQNLPVVFALDRAGFVGDDGETHQGLFDISLLRSVPGMTMLAPASAAELAAMLDEALAHGAGPSVIRYPKARCPPEIPAFSAPLETGRGVWVHGGAGRGGVCLAFTGGLYREVMEAARIIEGDLETRRADGAFTVPVFTETAFAASPGMAVNCYNLRFLCPVDENYFVSILENHTLTVIIEEGIKEGGFGEYAAELAARRVGRAYGGRGRLLVLAARFPFGPQGKREELLARNGLDGRGIAAAVTGNLFARAERGPPGAACPEGIFSGDAGEAAYMGAAARSELLRG
ncbi:MAG: 1-deoxy-D-xylulose-5-phosphate synthase [Spirochaetaceae bacterium]|jgi:1-deoxy-D-xylulose-5-phosphate synthase|nr:1-deoxy-D-xylulose-5-phosphate synthase [Spirochaetaceae bacterium]